jgi:branched-chain amino acid transport system permease protein
VSETASPSAAAPSIGHARVRRGSRASVILLAVAVVGVAWMLNVANGDSKATQNKLVDICVFATLATMWNLLAGYSGLVSIGQQAYVGLGAYGLIVFANGLDQNIYFAIIPAALVATVLAIPIGFVAFRLRSGYFAVGTWVLAEVVHLLVKNNKGDIIKGGSGTSLIAPTTRYPPLDRSQNATILAVLIAVAAVTVTYLVLRSRLGLGLQAIRDNEHGAAGLGVSVYRSRFIVYLIAAFFAALAAGVHYLQILRVQPDNAFGVADWTAPIIVMVVIGGIGTIEGPLLGAVIWYLAKVYLTDKTSTIHVSNPVYLIGSGLVAVVFALYVQRGIWGLVQRSFPRLQLFPVRRRVEGLAPDSAGGKHGP